MANRVTIEPTEFTNVRNGEISRGVRVYDDYEKTYDNTLESIPDDDLELLKLVAALDDEEIRGMLSYLVENEAGVCISDEWYDWEQIKPILVKA